MLNVDITKILPDFTLHMKFSIEQDILVLFGPSAAARRRRCVP